MYEFWYDYVKKICGEKAKLYCMNTNSFVVYLKTDDIYKDIVEDVEIRFDTSNNPLEKPLPKEKIGLKKDELGGKIMLELVRSRAQYYSYIIDDDSEDKAKKYRKVYD